MRVYLVEKICDYEYGCTEVVRVFFNKKSARKYINKQPDVGTSRFGMEVMYLYMMLLCWR